VDTLLTILSTNQDTGLLILVDVDGVVEFLELNILAPVLSVLKLTEGFTGNKLASTQIPPAWVSRSLVRRMHTCSQHCLVVMTGKPVRPSYWVVVSLLLT
jgi:hypothetical protein